MTRAPARAGGGAGRRDGRRRGGRDRGGRRRRPPRRGAPGPRRPGGATALEAVADALDERAGELAVIADTETALGGERLSGEVARTTAQLRMFAEVLRDGSTNDAWPTRPRACIRMCGGSTVRWGRWPCSRRPTSRSRSRWPGGDTASALAAGCPVVVKAHEAHPVTSDLTAEVVTGALASAGAPGGCSGWCTGWRRAYGCSGTRMSRRPGSPGPLPAGWPWPGSAPSGRCRSRSTASSARSTRGGAAWGRVRASRRDRHRVRRFADARRRPVLHQPRPAVRPRGRGAAVRDRRGGERRGRRPDAVRADLRRLRGRGGRGAGSPGRHRAGRGQPGPGPWAPRRGCSRSR